MAGYLNNATRNTYTKQRINNVRLEASSKQGFN